MDPANRPADDLTLDFGCIEVYKTGIRKQRLFDRFYFWGEMILEEVHAIIS